MKDYKKILEGVVNIINTTEKSDIGFANICTYIGEKCPELKESEDERVKKRILLSLEKDLMATKNSGCSTKDLEDCITWLEKQGKQKQEANYPKFDFNDILALQCCMETVKKVQEDKELYGQLQSLHNRLYDAYQLEKQGEQKPVIDFKAKNWYVSKVDGKIHDITYNSTDMVEPKFHEGDQIIHQGTENIYKVVARIDNQYQLKYGDNYTVQKCADVNRCARLWDATKDAKKGE